MFTHSHVFNYARVHVHTHIRTNESSNLFQSITPKRKSTSCLEKYLEMSKCLSHLFVVSSWFYFVTHPVAGGKLGFFSLKRQIM